MQSSVCVARRRKLEMNRWRAGRADKLLLLPAIKSVLVQNAVGLALVAVFALWLYWTCEFIRKIV